MFERMGSGEVFLMFIPMLFAGAIPLLITIWVLLQLNRAVRALESIAGSLRQNRQP